MSFLIKLPFRKNHLCTKKEPKYLQSLLQNLKLIALGYHLELKIRHIKAISDSGLDNFSAQVKPKQLLCSNLKLKVDEFASSILIRGGGVVYCRNPSRWNRVLNIDEKEYFKKDHTHNQSFTKKRSECEKRLSGPWETAAKAFPIPLKKLWCAPQFCWVSTQSELSAIDVSRWIMHTAVYLSVMYLKCPWCANC